MSEEWFYCIKHKTAEPKGGCPTDSRLGPYATKEEAEQALLRARQRNKAWDNDPKWREDE